MDPEVMEGGSADITEEAADAGDLSDDIQEKRQKSRGQRASNFLERHFLKFLFAISLLIAWLEYANSVQDKRIRASLELVQNWEAQGYFEDFRVLENKVVFLREEGANLLPPDTTISDRGLLIANYVQGQLGRQMSEDVSQAFERVIFFFNKAGLCAETRICDIELLERFFGHNADFVRDYFEIEILRRREIVSDYASYALSFADGRKVD